jgi:nitrile hydratase subunit beta
VERAVHDRGGHASDAPIDRTEHELADWELTMDAIVGGLGSNGLMNVDELRRAIESMPRADYEAASYYERWLFAAETVLGEKGVLAPGELDARLAP